MAGVGHNDGFGGWGWLQWWFRWLGLATSLEWWFPWLGLARMVVLVAGFCSNGGFGGWVWLEWWFWWLWVPKTVISMAEMKLLTCSREGVNVPMWAVIKEIKNGVFV